MRTSVEVSDPLFRQVEALAAEEGATVGELVEEGLRLVLERRRAAVPFELRDASVDGRGVQAGIVEGDWSQFRPLSYEGRSE